MKLYIEISLYPFSENYIDDIRSFIKELQKHEKIQIESNKMSTIISGDYQDVMHVFTTEIQQFFDQKKAVLVAKMTNARS